jgi:hypothetical protein
VCAHVGTRAASALKPGYERSPLRSAADYIGSDRVRSQTPVLRSSLSKQNASWWRLSRHNAYLAFAKAGALCDLMHGDAASGSARWRQFVEDRPLNPPANKRRMLRLHRSVPSVP